MLEINECRMSGMTVSTWSVSDGNGEIAVFKSIYDAELFVQEKESERNFKKLTGSIKAYCMNQAREKFGKLPSLHSKLTEAQKIEQVWDAGFVGALQAIEEIIDNAQLEWADFTIKVRQNTCVVGGGE